MISILKKKHLFGISLCIFWGNKFLTSCGLPGPQPLACSGPKSRRHSRSFSSFPLLVQSLFKSWWLSLLPPSRFWHWVQLCQSPPWCQQGCVLPGFWETSWLVSLLWTLSTWRLRWPFKNTHQMTFPTFHGLPGEPRSFPRPTRS